MVVVVVVRSRGEGGKIQKVTVRNVAGEERKKKKK